MATRRRGVKNTRLGYAKTSKDKQTYRIKSNKVTRKFGHLYHIGGVPSSRSKKPTIPTSALKSRAASSKLPPLEQEKLQKLLKVREPSREQTERNFTAGIAKGRHGKNLELLTMECMVKSFDKDGRLLASLLALPKNARVDMPASLYTRNGIPTNVSIKAKEIKIGEGYFEKPTGTSKTINSGSPINLLITYLEDYPFEMIYIQYAMTERTGLNGRTINHMTPGNGIKLDLKKLLGFVFEGWPGGCEAGARDLLERIKTLSVSRDTSPDKQITRNAIHEINTLIEQRLDARRLIGFNIDPKISSSDASAPRIQCSLNIDFASESVRSCLKNDEVVELSSAESVDPPPPELGWAKDVTRQKPGIQAYIESEKAKKDKKATKSKQASLLPSMVIEVNGKNASKPSPLRRAPVSSGKEVDIELGNIVTIESLTGYEDATPEQLCSLNFSLYGKLTSLAGILRVAAQSAAEKVSSCFSGFPSFSGLTSRLFAPSPTPAAAAASFVPSPTPAAAAASFVPSPTPAIATATLAPIREDISFKSRSRSRSSRGKNRFSSSPSPSSRGRDSRANIDRANIDRGSRGRGSRGRGSRGRGSRGRGSGSRSSRGNF